VLGWDVNADLVLDPALGQEPHAELLGRLRTARPGLEVRLLIWDWILFYSLDRQPLPRWRFGTRAGPSVDRSALARRASDHLPLWADVEATAPVLTRAA
jgi:hypothetical protein